MDAGKDNVAHMEADDNIHLTSPSITFQFFGEYLQNQTIFWKQIEEEWVIK